MPCPDSGPISTRKTNQFKYQKYRAPHESYSYVKPAYLSLRHPFKPPILLSCLRETRWNIERLFLEAVQPSPVQVPLLQPHAKDRFLSEPVASLCHKVSSKIDLQFRDIQGVNFDSFTKPNCLTFLMA